ncbi:biotin--protein ligase [Octopus sinensis]|uniref:Biotin--protein ligase n=1 Tax=Octopus sinensis TaxID=2607531 RepID=A0A6P7U7H3_9MOLL|nr:biotin--protein ligase [Octopus sinensis]
MIFSLVYYVSAIIRWCIDRRRSHMYLRQIGKTFKKSSLLFQQVKHIGEATESLTVIQQLSPFLKNVLDSRFSAPLVQDAHLHLVSIHPAVTVNLKDWHLYRDVSNEDLQSFPPDILTVLLEAGITHLTSPVDNLEEPGKEDCIEIHDYGRTLAWKAGMPCSILMSCTPSNLLNMGLAVTNGKLRFQELTVESILSINIEGCGSNLILPPAVKDNLKRYSIGSENSIDDQDSCCCHSNEALASPCASETHSDEDLLLDSDSEMAAGDVKYEKMEADEAKVDLEFQRPANVAVKPPNILVYCGKKDSKRKFESFKTMLEKCLSSDCYAIYQLQHNQINTAPWMDNTILLVIACERLYDDIDHVIFSYFEKGGKLMSLASNIDSLFLDKELVRRSADLVNVSCHHWSNVPMMAGRYIYSNALKSSNFNCTVLASESSSQNSLIVKLESPADLDQGVAVLSQVYFDSDHCGKPSEDFYEILCHLMSTHLELECSSQDVPQLTPAKLFTKTKVVEKQLLDSLASRLKDGTLKSSEVSLTFVRNLEVLNSAASAVNLPVVISDDTYHPRYFNAKKYWDNLHSAVLGNAIFFVEVVPSTMPLLNQMLISVPKTVGMIAIAGRQTTGKGRGGNQWLSPVGCAMFTLHVQLDRSSLLGSNPVFLQHIVTVSVVRSVRTLPGYEELDLRVKWPNDLYYGKKTKLGGVIVNSSIATHSIDAIIGCGFNVENSKPTFCINDLIHEYNIENGKHLAPLNKDQLIARTVTIIEELIGRFNTKGHEDFQQLYYQYWLHRGAKVRLECENNLEVDINGLDENGFLQVKTAEGRLISVQPDGNTFDFMKNLIAIKTN